MILFKIMMEEKETRDLYRKMLGQEEDGKGGNEEGKGGNKEGKEETKEGEKEEKEWEEQIVEKNEDEGSNDSLKNEDRDEDKENGDVEVTLQRVDGEIQDH